MRLNLFLYFAMSVIVFFPQSVLGETASDGGVVSAVAPVYPELAYRARVHGATQVEVDVDEEGNVIGASVSADGFNSYFKESSEKAARRWKFSINPGEKVVRKYRITFKFVLMPEYTKEEDLTTIYHSPYEMEIRVKEKTVQPL